MMVLAIVAEIRAAKTRGIRVDIVPGWRAALQIARDHRVNGFRFHVARGEDVTCRWAHGDVPRYAREAALRRRAA